MKRNWTAAAGAALILASFFAPLAQAESISGVEGARAKTRTGEPLSPRERAMMHRWGTGTGRHIPSSRIHRSAPNGGY